uniref:Integrase catalytic domain-containing protein n=1 Tax=Chromera velia CCMP2878 TaxID=1169474 RepID=A0A0G4GH59_9ALVE|eukprot:Cvel_4700.t1-p1 / transcript=Cvel_4700.t1 / gene=Cvel_4700 / organism=Chromera_velia_CCMP2878 / gene_product=hypothetical protein / transcript_product=hypothetical protein / location=Cvel_scaffold209:7285-8883(+) / protein_length=305 / sequence_SO=supercontig / SO=protein_coding / is_pseudo=false
MPVHHRAYLVRDREDGSPSVEPLLRPHKLVLMETAAESWFVIIDAVSGKLKEFRIDCSRGDSSYNIPYVVMQSAKRVYTSPYQLSAVSYETAMMWHRRLLHCGEEQLVSTLKENGLVAWRDVLDKLLHLIIAEQIISKIIRSDNDTVLKLGKTKQLAAAEYNIYLEPSPPHCSKSHGAVEVANREIRTMLRTVLKEIGCDAYVWPVLIPGIEQTYNVIFAPLIEIDGVLQPVQLIGKMGKKSTEVALMRMDPLGTWRPSEICHVEKAKIVRLFTMMDGEVPKEIMDAVQKSEIDGNGTGTALMLC